MLCWRAAGRSRDWRAAPRPERLWQAARQRNVLVHSYLEVDDGKVLESLEHLDDLRSFARAVQQILDADQSGEL